MDDSTDISMIPFSFKTNQIRTIRKADGSIWFVAKDVCDVLGYVNVAGTLDKLDEDEKLIYKICISGQDRDVWTVSESGLYTLIMRSSKPDVKTFRRWVTHDVIPALRKDGQYYLPNNAKKMGSFRKPAELSHSKLINEVNSIVKYAKSHGYLQPQAELLADKIVREKYGVNFLDTFGIKEDIQKRAAEVPPALQTGHSLVTAVLQLAGCLDHKENCDLTIEGAIMEPAFYGRYRNVLEVYGIKWIKQGETLFFAPPLIEKYLIPKMPGWEGCAVRDLLLTVPNASSGQIRMGGSPVRGVKFPWRFPFHGKDLSKPLCLVDGEIKCK